MATENVSPAPGVDASAASRRARARVLILGVGGLGSPVAFTLAHAGIGTLVLVDCDVVDRTNLHRQILFRDADVGRPKLEAMRDALIEIAPKMRVEMRSARFRPECTELLEDVDVVVECTDRYAVKFLAADVARRLHTPIVHGAAIRWIGTAFSVGPEGGPCYRCLFEAPPEGGQATCDLAGVVGPVCGIVGAVQAAFALRIVDQPQNAGFGRLASVDGRVADHVASGPLRMRSVARRSDCALCGIGDGGVA